MVLPRMLAWAQFNFRALGRWSNPPSRPSVSTRTRALLPWVSSSVGLSGSSPQGLGSASNDVLRRYQPAFPPLCSSSSNTRGPRLAVRTPLVEGTARLPCRLTPGHDACAFSFILSSAWNLRGFHSPAPPRHTKGEVFSEKVAEAALPGRAPRLGDRGPFDLRGSCLP